MTILLSIKPEFADAIFEGKKRYEFRRIIFKHKVTRVVVYATAPVSMVIGEFTVESVLYDEIGKLWEATHHYAGVSESIFFDYFAKKSRGYAIKIGSATLYKKPICLKSNFGVNAPQSFLYLDDHSYQAT